MRKKLKGQLICRVGITVLLFLSVAFPLQAEEQSVIRAGGPVSVSYTGSPWQQSAQGLQGGGAGREIYAKKVLGTGDAEITIRMSLEKPDGTAAAVILAGGRFGLDGRGKMFFTEAGHFGGLKQYGSNVNHIQPDIPFTLVITRKQDQIRFKVDGNEICTHTLAANIPLGRIGLRPHRGTLKVQEFSISGVLTDKVERASIHGDNGLEFQQVFANERFPNIVVTKEGTLLATWGSANVRAMRSEDGGKTWGDEIFIGRGLHGGGTTVDETTGDILVFVEDRHPPAPLTVYRSRDDGKTWTVEQVDVKRDSRDSEISMHMNDKGITLQHGQYKGRLVRPARSYGEGNRPSSLFPTHYTNLIYSDDGGKTWIASEPFPEFGTGEACVVELSDGRLYYNTRRHWAPEGKTPLRRWDGYSDDGGATWNSVEVCQPLPDGPQSGTYGCMGGLCRMASDNKDILVYSNCDSSGGRNMGTAWVSFDGGKTWPIKRLIFEGRFAYSAMTAGRPGTPTEGWFYVHFEGGPQGGSTVTRFDLPWLLQGVRTGDGDVPEWARLINAAPVQ